MDGEERRARLGRTGRVQGAAAVGVAVLPRSLRSGGGTRLLWLSTRLLGPGKSSFSCSDVGCMTTDCKTVKIFLL